MELNVGWVKHHFFSCVQRVYIMHRVIDTHIHAHTQVYAHSLSMIHRCTSNSIDFSPSLMRSWKNVTKLRILTTFAGNSWLCILNIGRRAECPCPDWPIFHTDFIIFVSIGKEAMKGDDNDGNGGTWAWTGPNFVSPLIKLQLKAMMINLSQRSYFCKKEKRRQELKQGQY